MTRPRPALERGGVPPDTAGAVRANDQPVSFGLSRTAHAPRWERRMRIPPGRAIGWDHLL